MAEIRAAVVVATEAMPGGWCELARRSGMDRASTYRAFKLPGRKPTLTTLLAVLPCLGMSLKLER